MSEDFKPSTRKLLQLVGWDEQPQYNDRLFTIAQEENYQLHRVALYISSDTFLGRDAKDYHRYHDDTWPIDSAMIAALRAALAEHPTGYAGYDLAHLLVRAGIEDKGVMERLHPWDRLMFRWRDDGLRAADVVATLRAAGTGNDLAPEQLAMIDAWIALPITAPDDWYPLFDALFGVGGRLVLANVKDPDCAQHDKLLRELLTKATPPVAVEEVSQSATTEWVDWIDPKGELRKNVRVEEWVTVKFSHAGTQHEFRFEGDGPCLNVAAIVTEIDRLLADLDRPDRVFQFMQQRSALPVHLFLVADGTRFAAAAKHLSLPLTTPS